MFESLNNPQKIYLNFNANKIRWLSDSKIVPSDFFCLGSAENSVSFIFRQIKFNSVIFFSLAKRFSLETQSESGRF